MKNKTLYVFILFSLYSICFSQNDLFPELILEEVDGGFIIVNWEDTLVYNDDVVVDFDIEVEEYDSQEGEFSAEEEWGEFENSQNWEENIGIEVVFESEEDSELSGEGGTLNEQVVNDPNLVILIP